jgi:hypothetical protein
MARFFLFCQQYPAHSAQFTRNNSRVVNKDGVRIPVKIVVQEIVNNLRQKITG